MARKLLILAAALLLALAGSSALAKKGGVPAHGKGNASKGHYEDNSTDVGISIQFGGGPLVVQPQGRKAKGGPPPWAPAHGYRAKHKYRYWPRNRVYYDTGRRLWFWLSGSSWRAGATLPLGMNLGGGYVSLEMGTSKPYRYDKAVRTAYPPGIAKKR
jgi:hypothetical protein